MTRMKKENKILACSNQSSLKLRRSSQLKAKQSIIRRKTMENNLKTKRTNMFRKT